MGAHQILNNSYTIGEILVYDSSLPSIEIKTQIPASLAARHQVQKHETLILKRAKKEIRLSQSSHLTGAGPNFQYRRGSDEDEQIL